MNANEMNGFILDEFKARGIESEIPAAVAHFGTMDRLSRWLESNNQENSRIFLALQVKPLPASVKDEILLAKETARETPLDLARSLKLPLVVVLYVADGEPKVDTRRRPWLRREYR